MGLGRAIPQVGNENYPVQLAVARLSIASEGKAIFNSCLVVLSGLIIILIAERPPKIKTHSEQKCDRSFSALEEATNKPSGQNRKACG